MPQSSDLTASLQQSCLPSTEEIEKCINYLCKLRWQMRCASKKWRVSAVLPIFTLVFTVLSGVFAKLTFDDLKNYNKHALKNDLSNSCGDYEHIDYPLADLNRHSFANETIFLECNDVYNPAHNMSTGFIVSGLFALIFCILLIHRLTCGIIDFQPDVETFPEDIQSTISKLAIDVSDAPTFAELLHELSRAKKISQEREQSYGEGLGYEALRT